MSVMRFGRFSRALVLLSCTAFAAFPQSSDRNKQRGHIRQPFREAVTRDIRPRRQSSRQLRIHWHESPRELRYGVWRECI
jgi:hypothetical protein